MHKYSVACVLNSEISIVLLLFKDIDLSCIFLIVFDLFWGKCVTKEVSQENVPYEYLVYLINIYQTNYFEKYTEQCIDGSF